jgi:hypothetical protein
MGDERLGGGFTQISSISNAYIQFLAFVKIKLLEVVNEKSFLLIITVAGVVLLIMLSLLILNP